MNHQQKPKDRSTRLIRQLVHPLLAYDPRALDFIDLIELEYFEAETTKAPVPRNQEVPGRVKTNLSGKDILVCTSHAWFYQSHPDPHGVKLKLIKERFAPYLRKRYPHTKIVVFDDWHSCPQWPRGTKEEEDRFRNAMNHMNSMYCYCDVVLFLESKLPDLDMTVRSCKLVPSEYEWSHFIDVVQFHSSDHALEIHDNDIVTSIEKDTNPTVDKLRNLNIMTSISFLRRPFGRPNLTPADERGWLFAERITLAIRMAAAPPSQFDDIIISNNENLRRDIFLWCEELRNAEKLERNKPGSIKEVLDDYKNILATKKFTWEGNDKLVIKIMEDLVDKFKNNWEREVKRQSSMSVRAREILLRWGCFSESYIKKARFLEESSKKENVDSVMRLLFLLIVTPSLAVLPFTFEPGTSRFTTSLWSCLTYQAIGHMIEFPLQHQFAETPLGVHTFYLYLFCVPCLFIETYGLRTLFSLPVMPFEFLCVVIIHIVFFERLLDPKFIPITDPRTENRVLINLRPFLVFPRWKRFSEKADSFSSLAELRNFKIY